MEIKAIHHQQTGRRAAADMAICCILGLGFALFTLDALAGALSLISVMIFVFGVASLFALAVFAFVRVALPAALGQVQKSASQLLLATFQPDPESTPQNIPGGLRRPPRSIC